LSARVHIVIVTGVAGSGKTTVGQALAARLGWRFHDADDLHSPESIERMRQNLPLDDELRQPWLDRVRQVLEDATRERTGTVIACSALRESYRRKLSAGIDGVLFVLLEGDAGLLRERLDRREGHFAGSGLLDSQLAALESPSAGLTVDLSLPVDAIVELIVARIR
jgi:carbohydrate kinase (thermoresistant glucokinase family)